MDDQAEALAFLAAGAGLGHAGAVVRIDTHASTVFLAGRRAFKLKRAVRYPYLDYSTVARRGAMCRAEYEINRRIAPALYRGVRAIRRRAGGGVGFGGRGKVVDWVLEMRRFDSETLFDRLAGERRLSPETIRDLADIVAAFHHRARRARTGGRRRGIATVIDGNLERMRTAGAAFDQRRVRRLGAAWRRALVRVATLLEKRRRQGKVRRCHGDLHLGNICLAAGKPTLFDAIEFSDDLTQIDVLYDLAFLLMDLLHRGLGELASTALNRYLDVARDDDGLAALPLFLSLRAGIRAHVAIAAATQQKGAARQRRQRDLAHSYLDLAERLIAGARPVLVAIGGLSGSGKSTVARTLAAYLPPAPGARVLRSDVLRKALLGLPPETKAPPAAYSRAMTRRVYARLMRDGAHVLAAGRSVILDAVFLDARERDTAERMAARARVPFAGIWVKAPPQVMVARVTARRGDASDATAAVLEQQFALDPGPIAWHRLDSSRPLPRVVAAARRLTARAKIPGMATERRRQR
jgi:hypothetical protein